MLHYLYSTALLWSTEERAPNRKYDKYVHVRYHVFHSFIVYQHRYG